MEKSAREKRKKGDEIIHLSEPGLFSNLFRNPPQKRAVKLYIDAGMTEEEAWRRAGFMLKNYGSQDAAADAYKKMKTPEGYKLAAEIYNHEAERNKQVGWERYGEHKRDREKGKDYPSFFRAARKYKKKAQESAMEGAAAMAEERREEIRTEGGLVKRLVTEVITIGGFVFAVFFLSANITGNVIGGLSRGASNWIGIILFVIGLIGIYFWKRKL